MEKDFFYNPGANEKLDLGFGFEISTKMSTGKYLVSNDPKISAEMYVTSPQKSGHIIIRENRA